jgi:hypothetical protein
MSRRLFIRGCIGLASLSCGSANESESGGGNLH